METLNAQIQPVTILKSNYFLNAKFPSYNKYDNFSDYLVQMDETSIKKVKVEEVIVLNDEDFKRFKNNLLAKNSWLKGKGGCGSDADLRDVEDFLQYTQEERDLFWATSYRLCIMVQDTKGNNILVDPQGYDYARYCGEIATK